MSDSDFEDEILALAGDVSENSKRSEQASEPGDSHSGSGEESRRTSGQKRKNRGSVSPSPEGEYLEESSKKKKRLTNSSVDVLKKNKKQNLILKAPNLENIFRHPMMNTKEMVKKRAMIFRK